MKSNIHGKNNDDQLLLIINIDVNSGNVVVDMMLMRVVSVVSICIRIVYLKLKNGQLFAMLYTSVILKIQYSINRLVRYPLRMNINKERKKGDCLCILTSLSTLILLLLLSIVSFHLYFIDRQ